MENNKELEEIIKVIYNDTSDDEIKKMIQALEEPSNNSPYITDQMLSKLSQYTYQNYAKRKGDE